MNTRSQLGKKPTSTKNLFERKSYSNYSESNMWSLEEFVQIFKSMFIDEILEKFCYGMQWNWIYEHIGKINTEEKDMESHIMITCELLETVLSMLIVIYKAYKDWNGVLTAAAMKRNLKETWWGGKWTSIIDVYKMFKELMTNSVKIEFQFIFN